VVGKVKVAKVYIRKEDVWASIELFCATPEAATAVMRRSIAALQRAVNDFVAIMRT
jgi:hypothetical protein